MTPYTTKSGLQIGSLYVTPRHVYHDSDALRVQSALLGSKRDKDYPVLVACSIAIVALIGMAAVGWL
jgi:hypothetical protein